MTATGAGAGPEEIKTAGIVALRALLARQRQQLGGSLSREGRGVLHRLVRLLLTGGIAGGEARACVTWLVGECFSDLPELLPLEILRVLAKTFPHEDSLPSKHAVVNLAVTLSLLLPASEKVQTLTTYVLEMAR